MDPRIDILIELLQHHRTHLSTAFEKVPPRLREVRPQPDMWSVANVIEHVGATERSVTKLITGAVATAEQRPDGDRFDREQFEREIDMPLFLDRSHKIKGSQPSGDMNGSQAWSALAESRRALLAAMQQATGRRLEASSRVHPATGETLNAYQWLAFLALHEGRHAAQVDAIAAAF